MSDFFSKRINKEKKELNKKEISLVEIKSTDDIYFEKTEDPIIDPEELKKELLKNLKKEPTIIMNEEDNFQIIEMIHFSSIDEFVSWYEKNKSFFSENQQKPLDTLIEARNMTLGGCSCTRQQRRNVANNYFTDFWMNNKQTDLLPTLQKILKTKKIIFGDFLSYP